MNAYELTSRFGSEDLKGQLMDDFMAAFQGRPEDAGRVAAAVMAIVQCEIKKGMKPTRENFHRVQRAAMLGWQIALRESSPVQNQKYN